MSPEPIESGLKLPVTGFGIIPTKDGPNVSIAISLMQAVLICNGTRRRGQILMRSRLWTVDVINSID